MFRRISFTGAIITVTVMTQAADPRSGVQRAAGQPISHPANIQRVAAPAGNAQRSSSGGLLGGLRNIFGGGGGGSDSEVGNGAMPDAPMSQQNAPVQDWSNLSHAPTRSPSNKSTSTAAAPKNLPKPPSNPNVPKPPTAGSSQAKSTKTGLEPPKVASRPERSEVGRSEAPVSTDMSGRRTTNTKAPTPPSLNVPPPEGDFDDVLPAPKVTRKPIPSSSEPAERVAQGPAETDNRSYPSTGRRSVSTEVAEEGTGRRVSRSTQPGLTESSNAPQAPRTTPPSAASTPKNVSSNSSGTSSATASKSNTASNSNNNSSAGANQESWNAPRSNTPTTQVPSTTSTPSNTLIATNLASTSTEIPAVRVTTRGPSEVPINQVVEYEILVENRGAADAPGLLVRATIPDSISVRGHNVSNGEAVPENDGGERRLLWQVNKVAAGGSERLVMKLAAEKASPFDVTVEWTCLPQTNVASIRVQEPKLELHIDGPEQVVFGKSQVYSVRVLNPGNAMAAGVTFTLSPNSATPQSQRLGDIPAGKEAKFEIELSAQDRGELEIHGLVTGSGELRSESIKRIRVAAAQLIATLDGPPLKYQNTEASYRLVLVNEGTAPSQNVTAQLRIPNGVQYISGIDGAEVNGDLLRWQVAELAPGQTRDYTIRCNMLNTGSHMLAFECTGTAAGAAAVSIGTKVEAVADLVLTVNDPAAPAPVGSEVMYEIILKNRGSKAATEIQAVAQFSQMIEPIRAEGHAAKLVPGQVIFDTINRLEAGQEVKLRVYAQASDGGVHRFRTEVTSGEIVLVAEEATKYISQSGDRVTRKSTDQPMR